MKIAKIIVICLIPIFVISFTVIGCKKEIVEETTAAETAAVTTAVAETTAVETTAGEPVTIRISMWGEAEVPGLNNWWKETAEMYMKEHPNVTVEPNEIPMDNIQQEWMAAVAAGDPPDIQLMGRQEGIDAATNGDILPIEDFWTEEEVNHILPSARRELGWDGKLWLVPEYMDPWLMVYNKKVFKDSGLDPEKPPTTWVEFMAAAEKIKNAGFIPFGMGVKDGYMNVWWLCLVGLQSLDDPSDIHQAVLGKQSFADPKHADVWKIMDEIKKKGYFNEDVLSLGMTEGNDLFYSGTVAMSMAVQPMIAAYVKELGIENVGAMLTPFPDITGKLTGTIPIPAMPLALANAKHPDIAADVLRFCHSQDRVNALYEIAHGMQANDLFDPSTITDAMDKQIAEWFLAAPGYTYNWHYTPQIEGEAYVIGQELLNGSITPEEAGKKMDDAAAKWRQDNPEMVKVFERIATEWASSN